MDFTRQTFIFWQKRRDSAMVEKALTVTTLQEDEEETCHRAQGRIFVVQTFI